MNEHDSGVIGIMLKGLGYTLSETPEDANLILFNTCTIREKAYHKAMSEIGRAKIYKKGNRDVIVGVCGCVAQEVREAIFERYPHVDILFGPDQILKLPKLISEAERKGRSAALDLINDPALYRFPGGNGGGYESRVTSHESRVTAFVSIMKGCNCACSYCIVPSVRGREISRPADDVIREITELVAHGVKEVVLLGQNVNAYSAGMSLQGLIRRVGEETGVLRIRFTSPHPKDIREDIIREYRENERLMPHIHLPVQAGSNKILKIMRRGYTRERYIETATSLREARPGLSITTDIIVGFSSETEGDFEQTRSLMRTVEFDSIFAFRYSPRPGTEAAAKFPDDVPPAEKESRLSEVLALQRATSKKHNEKLAGTKSEVLVTGPDHMREGRLTGRLPDNRIIHFTGNIALVGSIVPVIITAASINSLSGEVAR